MWLLLSTLICGLLKVSGQYELRENVGTWTDAYTNCTLARPVRNWSGQEVKVALALKNIQQDKAWIGYIASYDIFQYIGCVLVQDLTSSSINYTAIQTPHGPGHCFHVCRNSTMFGLRNTGGKDCFCLENSIGDINKTRNNCSVSCNNDKFLCGNTASLSLYSKVQINELNTDTERCITVKRGNYNWKRCNDQYHPLCFKDVNDTSPTPSVHNMSWKEAMNECFEMNQFPMTEEHDKNSSDVKEYWTAYVNAVIIIDNERTSEIDKYGYIKREKDNTLKLKFTRNEYITTTALCQIATSASMSTSTTSTTTTTATTTTTGATTTTTGATTTAISVTTEHTIPYEPSTVSSTTLDDTTTSHVSGLIHTGQPVNTSEETNENPKSDTQVSEDSKAGIYVSIPLVILVCVCVAIVLLIWYRKSEQKQIVDNGQMPITKAYLEHLLLRIYAQSEYSWDVRMLSAVFTILLFYRQGRQKADPIISTRCNHGYDGSNYDELGYVNMTEENDGDASKIPNTLADMHYESIDVHAAGIYDFALDTSDDTANKNTAEPSYFVLEKVERPPEVSPNDKMTTPESITDHTDTAYNTANHNLNVYNTANHNLNVYNTANHNTDAENYDHVEKKKLNAVEDGHYDTTSSSGEREPDYDTTNQSRNVNGEQDGTYDSTYCTDGGEKVYAKGQKHDDYVNGNFNN